MGKRRSKTPQPVLPGRRVDLTNVPDSSGTVGDPISEKKRKNKSQESYQKVDLPFKSAETKENPITWNDLGLIWKVGAAIASFFVFIVIPVVWFASDLNTNVGMLREDVKDVKKKTDELVSNSVKYSQRLDGLEKNISAIDRGLSSRPNPREETGVPNRPIKPTQ